MEYINYIISGAKVLIDRTYDFVSYKLMKDNDLDNDLDDNNVITSGYKKRIFTQKPKIEQMQIFFSEPTHIIDNLYLGSAFNASHYDTLKKLNIGLIINMTNEISNYYENEIIYKKYGIYDDNKHSIINYLDLTYDDIITFQTEYPEKNILIHCFMGASRSASIMAYYLYKKHEYCINDAVIFLKNKREVVNLTVLFYNELTNIEKINKI